MALSHQGCMRAVAGQLPDHAAGGFVINHLPGLGFRRWGLRFFRLWETRPKS